VFKGSTANIDIRHARFQSTRFAKIAGLIEIKLEVSNSGVDVACEDLRPISCRARRGDARVHEKGSEKEAGR
jgi:hypothetical protein